MFKEINYSPFAFSPSVISRNLHPKMHPEIIPREIDTVEIASREIASREIAPREIAPREMYEIDEAESAFQRALASR